MKIRRKDGTWATEVTFRFWC